VCIGLLVLSAHTPALPAQQRLDPAFQEQLRLTQNRPLRLYLTGSQFSSLPAGMQQGQASTTRLVVGGLLGGAAGFAIGALVGAVIGGANGDSEEEFVDAVWGSAVGATVAESIGLAAGVHLSNRREGNLLLSALASLAIGGAGLAILVENQDPPIAPAVLVAAPLAQLAAAIGIARATR
jgi:hypothetical protein